MSNDLVRRAAVSADLFAKSAADDHRAVYSCDRFVFCGEKSGFAGRNLSYVSTRLRPDCRCVGKLKAAECLPAVVLGGQQMLHICIIDGTEHVNLSGLLIGTSNANWLGSRQQTEQLFKNDLA
ncbi:MAG: hypothetical protein VB875_08465 [Pirellulales bacterium]